MGSWRRLGELLSQCWSCPCEGEREDLRLWHCSWEKFWQGPHRGLRPRCPSEESSVFQKWVWLRIPAMSSDWGQSRGKWILAWTQWRTLEHNSQRLWSIILPVAGGGLGGTFSWLPRHHREDFVIAKSSSQPLMKCCCLFDSVWERDNKSYVFF